MTQPSPCSSPENDPQDWFIRSDGKQYPFEDLLTPREVRSVSLTVLKRSGETEDEHATRVEKALAAARNNRKRAALARRQRAKALCFSSCPMLQECFSQQLEERHHHGTWGGHLEEEWIKIFAERDSRHRLL